MWKVWGEGVGGSLLYISSGSGVLCWAGWSGGYEPLRCRRATASVSSPGRRGLPAAQSQESKRDGMRVLTGLTQFIWKISGENMSNKDRNSDRTEQTWISVGDRV